MSAGGGAAVSSRVPDNGRYVMGEGLNIEVDVYPGARAGLSVAEVEFGTAEAADAFELPAWLGREVTEDGRFKDQRLASEGAPADAGE